MLNCRTVQKKLQVHNYIGLRYKNLLKSVQYFRRCSDKIYDFLKEGITLSNRIRPQIKFEVHQI
jgi:hypothetical protein